MREPITFEGRRGKWFYTKIAFRPPLKGEYYLSGAIVQAWRAPNNLSTAYHVVEPLKQAIRVVVWK